MPIYLRRYYLKRLQKQYDDESDAYKKSVKKAQSRRPKIKRK